MIAVIASGLSYPLIISIGVEVRQKITSDADVFVGHRSDPKCLRDLCKVFSHSNRPPALNHFEPQELQFFFCWAGAKPNELGSCSQVMSSNSRVRISSGKLRVCYGKSQCLN